MAFQYVLPHAVTSQLDSLRVRIRRVAFLRGCGLFLTLSCGLLVATLLIDFLFDLEASSRLTGFAAFCIAEVVLFGFLLVRPLVIRLKDPEVALLAEEKFPELGERVSSLVELADPDIPEDEKGSPLMRDLLEEETLDALARCDFNEAVSVRPAVRRLGYGFGTLSFLALSLLIFPSVSSLLLARLFNPWGNYESVSRLIFDIEGADEFVARGDDIEIVARMTWRNGSGDPIPEPVQLSWRSDDGNSDIRTLSFDPDQDAFTTAIPDVQDSLEFFVSSEGSRSKRYQINVLDRPEVLTAKLEITPPGYLGRPRETLDGVTGEISVFEHSKLTFDLTFSHPVEEASINWLSAMVLPESDAAGNQQIVPSEDDDEAADEIRTPGTSSNSLVTVDNLPATQLIVSDDGLSARLQTPATIQGAFAFLLKESHGLENDSEPFRQLIITRDQPPILEVPGGEQDRARPTDVYGIRVSAVDDVALEEVELHVSSREGLNRVIKAPSELLGQESLDHEFRLDLSDIAVASGDFLKLQIRAADGRPTPSPNIVWSKVRYVAISDDASAQGTSDVLARQEQIRKELQDIRDQLRAAVEQSDELRDDARQSLDNDRKFAQQESVTTLAEQEAELAGRIAELSAQFSQHPLFANLSDELWNMAAEELDPSAIKLADSTTQELKDQIATIDENSAVADMVEEGLANVAAKFEKLAELEEDLLELNRIAQRANQLADDAVQLDQHREELAAQEPDAAEPLEAEAAQRHEEARQELAENQQLLMEEQSELMAALDNLMQQRPELLEAARDHQLEKLADLARQASEIADPQELLAESLEKDAEQARQAAAPLAERQQEIAEQIEELAAQANAQQNRQPVTPIDPELARKIADELLEGNLDKAEELSKQAQQDLAGLAKELAENAQLPADPKEAAAELAKRQQALAEEIADAADSSRNQAAEPGASPESGQEATTPDADLGQLAARQAALQMATAQLQADRQSRDEQQAAVDEAAETLQKLIEAAKQEPAEQAAAIAQAAQEGEEAADALEQLAENILPEAQQQEEALEELQRLRKEDGTEDEELSDAELAARLQDLLDPPQPEPEQVARQARQLAQAQRQLREETETLDDEFVPDAQDNNQPGPASEDAANEGAANENAANEQARSDAAEPLAEQQAALAEQAESLPAELGALQRAEALEQLEQAQQALENGQLQAAADAQQEAQAALENFAREADALAQASAPNDSQAAASGEQPAGDAAAQPEPAQPEPASGQPAGNPSIDAIQPSEQLAAQAEQLADLQQQLQEAIAEFAQQPAENTPAGEQVADAAPSQQSPPSNAEPGNAEPGNSEPGNSEPGSPAAPQTLGELLAQQEELTTQAAQLALQSAQQAGAESAATQSAAQSAQQSAEAENAARGGQFAQAASEASNAQQAAAASAEALQEAAPALAEQAQQLAEQQQQMAEAFEQLENSPAQRAAAQQTQQQQLAAQADQVAQALDELAEQLGAQPLDLQQQGQQASSAQQSAQQGQQSASQAAQNMQAGNQGQAAQAAQQAADALRASAQQAAANATPASNSSPVPGEFAAQIAEAMRQLQQAQQQLAQAAADVSQASEASGQPNSETGEPATGNSEPGATALDAATGEAAAAQPPSGDSSSNGEPGQGQPSQGDTAEQPGGTPSPSNAASDSQSDQHSGQPTPGTPNANGQPSSSQGNQPGQPAQQRNGALAEAADALQQAAEMLSDAAQQLAADGSQSEDNQGQSNQQPSSQQPGLGNSGTGSFADGEIKGPLDTELKRRAMKNWGKLSGNLKTEILQSSQRKANGDYARLIKLYFEALAKAGQSERDDQ